MSEPGLVLGIESSCDETAAAVLAAGRRVLSSVVASQDDVHAPYGGVVPELASRRHIEVVVPVVERALADAGVRLADLDGIAVTHGPGLVGSLLVGCSMAKALAWVRRLPLVGVNHLEGHIFAAFLADDPPEYPFVALVVSGGHTALYHAPAPLRYALVGQTRDDAAGEAFDKVAKLLGLGFPGGPVVQRIAERGDPAALPLPLARMSDGGADFSFSGIKTAVSLHVKRHGPLAPGEVADVAASFQAAVVRALVRPTVRALNRSAWAMLSNQTMRSPRPRAMSRKRRRVSSSQLSRCPSTSLTDHRSCVPGRRISTSGSRETRAMVERRTSLMERIARRRQGAIEAARRLAIVFQR